MIKSVPSITVWLHKVCRVMTNGDRKRLIFLSHPLTIDGFFSPADNLLQLNVFVVFFGDFNWSVGKIKLFLHFNKTCAYEYLISALISQ